LDGTRIVRRLLLPLVVKRNMDGLKVANGPGGLTIADSVRFPWKPLRPLRLRVCVKLLPACIITLLAGLLMLKSVTMIIS
jgi:hypothetical protein